MATKLIEKRDGRHVEFDPMKIASAIERALAASGFPGQHDTALTLARKVETMLELENDEPDVEHVQDLVEQVLMREG